MADSIDGRWEVRTGIIHKAREMGGGGVESKRAGRAQVEPEQACHIIRSVHTEFSSRTYPRNTAAASGSNRSSSRRRRRIRHQSGRKSCRQLSHDII